MDTETHEDPEMSATEYENLVLTDRVYQLQLLLQKAHRENVALRKELDDIRGAAAEFISEARSILD